MDRNRFVDVTSLVIVSEQVLLIGYHQFPKSTVRDTVIGGELISGTIASHTTLLSQPIVVEFMDRQMIEILRSKTTTEKIAMLGAAHRTAKKLVACGVRGIHPEWSDEQVQYEVTRRMFRGTT